ncbi:MAG TPA: homoserine kinase [Clostridia bacterium]|nr:homoserine kinase [Clostridia bacterium]
MVTNWLAELDGRRATVEVPATSANLGAGYDCLALALAMTNRITVEVRSWSRGQIELTVDGEGSGELSEDRDNRFVRGVEAAMRLARGDLPDGVGWRVEMRNEIPLSRGLGSSAAATVGGLVAANALLGGPLATHDLLGLATGIEGHPDNAAAALLGGFVVSAASPERVDAVRFDVPRDLRAILFVPDMRLSTGEMRDVLPDVVPRADAVANLAAVAIGVAGLATRRYDVLRRLTVDRLHEPYRAAAFPQLPRLIEAALESGAIGACLSGAGSSVIAFSDSLATISRIEAGLLATAADTDLAGRVLVVAPRNAGATVTSTT